MKLNLSIRDMVLVGVCAALMGVFSQLSIPLPTVPLTLQVFGVVVIAVILEGKLAAVAMIIFALLGAIGIPVYSNFTAGFGALAGATGGYIIGFIFMAFTIGNFATKESKVLVFIGAYMGLAVDYFFGVLQLKLVMGLGLQKALVAGFYPFIIKDMVMVGIGVIIAMVVKKKLNGVLRGNAKVKTTSY